MKKIICLLLVTAFIMPCLFSCKDEIDSKPNTVVIDVENYGKITVELYPDIAPITVKNFKSLVNDGFYDGLIFHRVIEGFMIQGGCPNGDGTGGNTDANGNEINIKVEFSENGVRNSLKHDRGVISMARSNDKNSASSQFFICHQKAAHLNGKYAAFGMVKDGMDVVDAIASVETNSADKPLQNVVIKSITFAE